MLIQVSRMLTWKPRVRSLYGDEDLSLLIPVTSSFFGLNTPVGSFHRNDQGPVSDTVSRFNVTSLSG